ncbi:MAG: hypothetical protein M3471_07695, partial [Actinomycetota bacterium]|nr:hypothetical protein [Actinomycetota bacterium]
RISLSIKQAAEGGVVSAEYQQHFGEHAYDESGNYVGAPDVVDAEQAWAEYYAEYGDGSTEGGAAGGEGAAGEGGAGDTATGESADAADNEADSGETASSEASSGEQPEAEAGDGTGSPA